MTRKLLTLTFLTIAATSLATWFRLPDVWVRWQTGSAEHSASVEAPQDEHSIKRETGSPPIAYRHDKLIIPDLGVNQVDGLPRRAVRPLAIRNAPRTIAIYEQPISAAELATDGLPQARPLARVPVNDEMSETYWPVLGEQSVLHHGKSHDTVRIRVGLPVPKKTLANDVPAKPSDTTRPLTDVVFSIDNTYSSELFLSAAQQAAVDLMSKLAPSHRVAIGVVLFRDYADGNYFGSNGEVTKVLGQGRLIQEREPLLQLLRSITPPQYGSGDWPEAVFDGLSVGLRHISWRPNSQRFLLWFGDSSSHQIDSAKNPYRLSVKTISHMARERHVQVWPIFIEGAGGAEEQALHRRQAEEIAAQTDGEVVEYEDRALLPARLASSATDTTVATFARTWASEPQTHVLANVATTDVTAEYVTGWTLATHDGQPRFERGWLLSRKQVEFLRSELQGLAETLRMSDRFSSTHGNNDKPVVSLFFSQPHTESWAALIRRAGVPVSLGVLNHSQREFLELPTEVQLRIANTIRDQWLTPLSAFLDSNTQANADVFISEKLLP